MQHPSRQAGRSARVLGSGAARSLSGSGAARSLSGGANRSRRAPPDDEPHLALLPELLSLLPRLRPQDVPALRPLPRHAGAPADPRLCWQGSDAWLRERRGCLTASSFASALGFYGLRGQRSLGRDFAAQLETGAALPPGQGPGCTWGQLHERSALATYAVSWLLPACPGAELLETGFWPIEQDERPGGDAAGAPDPALEGFGLGASPDALLEGIDSLCGPGGALVEVKCPWVGGQPVAAERVLPRQMPQMQGALRATGRSICHLLSWSPTGANVFHVELDEGFADEMVGCLTLFGRAVAARRPGGLSFTPAEAHRFSELRQWAAVLAERADLVGVIPPEHCFTLLADDDHERERAAAS